ncbi:MAG: AbrB/MazE/SpoVT family DNA-binding domain-containing protein [Gemmatimonadota bacterium]
MDLDVYSLYIRRSSVHDSWVKGIPMRTHICKWGNSLAIRIPKAFVQEGGLQDGTEVEIALVGGKIVLTPVGRDYDLEALVEGITPENRHAESDWGGAVGNEVW